MGLTGGTENAVAGDTSAQVPGGIRLGTSALTSRNMLEADMHAVAEFLHRAVQIALVLQQEAGSKLLKDFVACVSFSLIRIKLIFWGDICRAAGKPEGEGAKQIRELRKDVVKFARRWPLPGADVATIQRPAGIEEDD